MPAETQEFETCGYCGGSGNHVPHELTGPKCGHCLGSGKLPKRAYPEVEEDYTGYEYRLVLHREGIHAPYPFFVTPFQELAETKLKMEIEHYRKSEEGARVVMERRQVDKWDLDPEQD